MYDVLRLAIKQDNSQYSLYILMSIFINAMETIDENEFTCIYVPINHCRFTYMSHIITKSYIYVKYILIQPCGFTYMSHICYIYDTPSCSTKLYRGYYTVA